MTKWILDDLERIPLSTSMARALRMAQAAGAKDLSRWCQLELGGYFASNPAMDEEAIVPEYRTVVGQHYDIYGRVLLLESDLAFVNETRLRNGVEELESLVSSRDTVVIHDADMCGLIESNLHVQVYSFRFSAVHLRGVLSAIKLQLSNSLVAIPATTEPGISLKEGVSNEILELRPNIYGIGINLRALWRRLTGADKRKES